MAVQVRPDNEIFSAEGGWFHARWHFSFDHYHDVEQMGVGPLRVFNDDRLEPGAVWPLHPHRDIESCTYVAEGHFAHQDSLGNGGRLHAGAAQVMRFSHAGALHSELNGSEHEPMRFMQFWFLPSSEGLESGVQQRQWTAEDRTDTLLQIMGPEGEDGLDLATAARVFVTRLTSEAGLRHEVTGTRGGYLYVMDGAIELGGEKLSAGDAAKLFGPEDVTCSTVDTAELILIDVPLEFRPVGVWAGRP
jgi:hypothetical protein